MITIRDLLNIFHKKDKENLFFDSDNVLFKFPKEYVDIYKDAGCDIFKHLSPIMDNINTMKQLAAAGNKCRIITHYYRDQEKKDKLNLFKEYFPFMKEEDFIFVPEGISKTYFVNETGILFDDYKKNCEDWEKIPGNIAVLIKQ